MAVSASASLDAFEEHQTTIVREVEVSVESLAGHCRDADIIDGQLHGELVSDIAYGTKRRKAKKLIDAVSERIEAQPDQIEPEQCNFKLFIGALRKDDHEELAGLLETSLKSTRRTVTVYSQETETGMHADFQAGIQVETPTEIEAHEAGLQAGAPTEGASWSPHVECSEDIEDPLDQLMSPDHRNEIGKALRYWQKWAETLELSGGQISGIESDRNLDYEMRGQTVLKLWAKKYKATYRALLKVALKMEDRPMAERICELGQGDWSSICPLSRDSDKMPKLAPAENTEEFESGLGEDSHNQEPIMSEIVTLSGEASGSRIHIPNRAVRKPFKSLTPSYTGFVSAHEDGNSVDYAEDQQVVSAVFENGGTVNQSLVMAPNKPILEGSSYTEISLEVMSMDNQSNLDKVEYLKKRLFNLTDSESKLKCTVQQLQKENYKLRTKEENMKKSEEILNCAIKDFKSKLQKKESKVTELKRKLGEVEKENQIQRQSYSLEIKELQSERDELKSRTKSLEQKSEQDRLELWKLRKQVNEKDAALNKARAKLINKFHEVCYFKTELANSKRVIAEQRADAAEKESESKAAKIKKMENDIAAEKKRMEEDNEQQLQIHRRNSVPMDVHDKCLKEMEEMRTQLKHVSLSVDRQSSFTESAQPSPSCSSGPESQDSMDNSTTLI